MTGSDAGWGCSSLFISPTLVSPKGPVAFSPSLPEPRQCLVSRDSALEDFGQWAFGTVEDTVKLGKLPSQASSGQAAGRVCSAGTGPLAWMDQDGGTMPHHPRGKQVSWGHRRKCPGASHHQLPPWLVPVALL